MNKRQQKELTILPFYYHTPFKRNDKMLKIYNDGHHYVGTQILPYHGGPVVRSLKSEACRFFDEQYINLLQQNEKRPTSLMSDIMLSKYPNISNIKDFVKTNVKRLWSNLHSRQKRLRRKANLNLWNKWVTFTYDPEKHDEINFKKKLRKCLSNLHTRRGWKYMGVWEHGKNGNMLHFHAIMYIPQNQMIGTIEEKQDWSTKQHKMQITHSNSFFAEKFGRNDFEELSEYELKNGSALDYLTKYISKTNERIVYSRDIPSELTLIVNNEDIATEYLDYRTKYVLFDDFIGRTKQSYYDTTSLPSFNGRIVQTNIFNDLLLYSS